MRLRIGALIGVVCSGLLLAGCAKEPAGESEAAIGIKGEPSPAADLAQVVGESAFSSQMMDCLAEGINHVSQKQNIDAVLKQPRDTIAVLIPSAELVYWGKGPDGTFSPVSIDYCEKVLKQLLTPRIADFANDHYKAADEDLKIKKELNQTLSEDIVANPFGVFNGVMKRSRAVSSVYEPSPKGDFEKTADYEARIAREKAEFDKASSGKKITPFDIEYVWMGLFGTPHIKSAGTPEGTDLYNPDTETLTLTIASWRGNDTKRPIEIPVKIKLTPEQAQKFFERFNVSQDLLDMRPVVVMQLHNGTLTVKEASFKYKYPEVWKDLGFTFDNIPVNQELARDFLSGV